MGDKLYSILENVRAGVPIIIVDDESREDEGDLVLDPFMGSGTTGIACRNLKRNFIGIELNEDYFNTAKKRIESHTVQSELF